MLHLGIIIAIAVGGTALLALLTYTLRWWFLRFAQLKLPLLEQRDGAFSISGNLVQELYVPITNYYTFTAKLLGRGSSAEVVIAVHTRTKRRYAVKIIDTQKKEIIWRYDREKNFLKDIEHPNVTRLFEVYVAPAQLFFVTDLCKDEMDARRYTKQVLSALIHVHKLGICHRDVKLQNIVRESNMPSAQVKLIDFGNSVRYVNKLPLTKVVGTTYTAAPEVFRKEYDERCDIWSLGVVCYILLCGKRPFEKTEVEVDGKHKDEGIINNILAGKFHFKHRQFGFISEEALDFVKVCMEMDYKRRAHAVDLLDHPWMVAAPRPSLQQPSNATHSPFGVSPRDAREAVDDSRSASPMKVPSESSMLSLSISLSTGAALRSLTARSTGRSFLSRCVLLSAVAFTLPNKRLQKFREVFQEIDRNGNGEIERDELRLALQQATSDLSVPEMDALFDQLDWAGRGTISYLTFVAACIEGRDVNVTDFENGFRVLDRERKGVLARADLRRALYTVSSVELLSPASPSDTALSSQSFSGLRIAQLIERVFQASDLNCDNLLSYAEYLFALSDNNASGYYSQSVKNLLTPDLLSNAPPSVPLLRHLPSHKLSSLYAGAPNIQTRRQSDGGVRLLGKQFRTRARSSFLTKKTGEVGNNRQQAPQLEGGSQDQPPPSPSLASPKGEKSSSSATTEAPVAERLRRLSDLNNKVAVPPPILPPSPHATSSLSPSSPQHAFSFRRNRNAVVFPSYTPYSAPPKTLWRRLFGAPNASGKIQKYNYSVRLPLKGGDVLSHVEDSDDEEAFQPAAPSNSVPAPAPSFSRQASARSHHSFASSISSGRGGVAAEEDAAEGNHAAPHRVTTPPPSRASFVRRLSSALFFPAGGGMRARALTSPAFLWSYALTPSLSPAPGLPSPSAQLPPPLDSSPLSPSRRTSESGRHGDIEEGYRDKDSQRMDVDVAGEQLWQESDDSLDRAPPRYLTPDEHALLQMRKHSLGQSLDSQMFQQFRSMDTNLAHSLGMRSGHGSTAGSRKGSGSKVLPLDQLHVDVVSGKKLVEHEILEDIP